MRLKLPYAIRDGNLICISEIPPEKNGLKCGCVCPMCKEPLIAKQGKIRTHYFAHQSAALYCEGATQSMLHMLAKKILSETKNICLPTCILQIENYGLELSDYSLGSIDATCPTTSPEHSIYGPTYVPVSACGGLRQIRSARVENRLGGIVSDLVLEIMNRNGKEVHEVIVEIFVTHKVDESKKKRIEELNLPALEIDLSTVYDKWLETPENLSHLKNIFLNPVKEKYWVYMPSQNQKIAQELNRRRVEDIKGLNLRELMRILNEKKAIMDQKMARYQDPANHWAIAAEQAEALKKDKTWLALVEKYRIPESSIPDIINVSLEGDVMFGCDRRLWQGELFYRVVCKLDSKKQDAINGNDLLNYALEYTKETWLTEIDVDQDRRKEKFEALPGLIRGYVEKLVAFKYMEPRTSGEYRQNKSYIPTKKGWGEMYLQKSKPMDRDIVVPPQIRRPREQLISGMTEAERSMYDRLGKDLFSTTKNTND